MTADRPPGSRADEIANAITHGVGAALSVAALVLLVVVAAGRGDPWRVVSFSVYGATLILLYTASTLYHGVRHPRVRRVLRALDHSAIFLLIAGTYTPVVLVTMRGPWGWTLFGLIWGLALVGIVSHAVLRSYPALSVALYLAMGWLAVIALEPMLTTLPPGLLLWLVVGGCSYTLGVVFYAMKRLRFHHAVWHLLVLVGSACHFFGLLFHVGLR